MSYCCSRLIEFLGDLIAKSAHKIHVRLSLRPHLPTGRISVKYEIAEFYKIIWKTYKFG